MSQAENTEQRVRRFLRLPSVAEATAKSRSTIYRDMAAGTFPKAHRIGPNSVAWDADEIARWQAERLAAKG
ncbi:helix-turn-helix transcriptional regulator [Denitromonas ohlonensis]|uniref:AlpA family phage regulatory protein n=2 Tax=Denitromonas TaxID=139331 RepID=A0A557RLC3_9RHOO|nr:AlpA family phage regulatory protein [Denitromonas ohlonensis]TVO65936.1 AlpA family phage regulatory protein [Denitromonas ohlonensis]TVO79529.1 AlpA family phage regulatory protein [Denitromonas ohlonensis]